MVMNKMLWQQKWEQAGWAIKIHGQYSKPKLCFQVIFQFIVYYYQVR